MIEDETVSPQRPAGIIVPALGCQHKEQQEGQRAQRGGACQPLDAGGRKPCPVTQNADHAVHVIIMWE